MKALVLTEYKKFELRDVPAPEFGEEEVLIEVKACGICGSDVHGMDGSTGRRRPPIIMGHEAAGVIAQAGRGVSGWKAGDASRSTPPSIAAAAGSAGAGRSTCATTAASWAFLRAVPPERRVRPVRCRAAAHPVSFAL